MSNLASQNITPHESLLRLSRELGYNSRDLIAMAPDNDPFYAGQGFQLREAEWFARVWNALGYNALRDIHLRRVHYRISGDERRHLEEWYLPGTKEEPAHPYENTSKHFERLMKSSKFARH